MLSIQQGHARVVPVCLRHRLLLVFIIRKSLSTTFTPKTIKSCCTDTGNDSRRHSAFGPTASDEFCLWSC